MITGGGGWLEGGEDKKKSCNETGQKKDHTKKTFIHRQNNSAQAMGQKK